jgi:hypothetical protein
VVSRPTALSYLYATSALVNRRAAVIDQLEVDHGPQFAT